MSLFKERHFLSHKLRQALTDVVVLGLGTTAFLGSPFAGPMAIQPAHGQVAAAPPAATTTTNAGSRCLRQAVAVLRDRNPQEARVFDNMTRQETFSFFLDCSDPTYRLNVAVHESVHTLGSTLNTQPDAGFYRLYYLPGGAISRVRWIPTLQR